MAIGYKQALELLKQGKLIRCDFVYVIPRIDGEKIRYDAFEKLQRINNIDIVKTMDGANYYGLQ